MKRTIFVLLMIGFISLLSAQFLKFADWYEYPESVIGYMTGFGYELGDEYENSEGELVLYFSDIEINALDDDVYDVSNLYFVFDEDERLYYGKMVLAYSFKPGRDDDILEETVIDLADLISYVYEDEYEDYDYEVESAYDFYVYWETPTTEILFTPFADSVYHGYYGLRIEFQRK
ncbi:MAG: hypothetical protein APR63_04430 [Desulfuromonas sp. SDB]|nr:MAG: hypothetical protein APR63_04430 [Desulfuromonas sp. SDB]